MKYILRGYDSYDREYYPIGEYDTFQEALAAEKAEKEKQKRDQNDDILEVYAMR